MQYKIIVDKQPSTNPSVEKREYIIDIEELRYKDGVYDSLIITKDSDYVIRRLNLSEYHVLSVLPEPVKEPLENVNIELFEGDNYIYISDMTGNKFYAEYLVKNDFTDLYVTKNQMTSAITQQANLIEFNVNQKLEGYSTTEEMNALIQILANQIALEVAKKVGDDEIIAKLNLAVKDEQGIIELIGNIITIVSDNFKLSKNGSVSCKNIDIDGGSIELTDEGENGDSHLQIKYKNELGTVFQTFFGSYGIDVLSSYDNIVSRIRNSQIIITKNEGEAISKYIWLDVDSSGKPKIMLRYDDTETEITHDKVKTHAVAVSNLGNASVISGNNAVAYIGTGSGNAIDTYLRGDIVRIYSHQSGAVYLGYSGGTAITSDEKVKDIYELDDKYIEFFKNLKPVAYIYKNRGHRNHIGFGARQVEEALTKAGLTTEQFAGVLKDTDVTISADEMGTEEDVHFDELYSLRYEEFIALNTMMIQKQQAINEKQQVTIEQNNSKIEELKIRIERLEELINGRT